MRGPYFEYLAFSQPRGKAAEVDDGGILDVVTLLRRFIVVQDGATHHQLPTLQQLQVQHLS